MVRDSAMPASTLKKLTDTGYPGAANQPGREAVPVLLGYESPADIVRPAPARIEGNRRRLSPMAVLN